MSTPSAILVRHASSNSSDARRLLGSLDERLSQRGVAEAYDVACSLRARLGAVGLPGRVITSPLARAREKALRIAECLGWRLDVYTEFAERDFGVWAGRSLDQPWLPTGLQWRSSCVPPCPWIPTAERGCRISDGGSSKDGHV